MTKTCGTCRFWSKWLPDLGDCMEYAHRREAAFMNDVMLPQRPARETESNETCDRHEHLVCGGEATMWGACGQTPEQWVQCDRCRASSDTTSGETRAAEKWNQRTAKTYADGLEDAAKVAVDKLKWLGDNTQADIVFDAIRALAKGDA